MNVNYARAKAEILLGIFSDLRLQPADIDHMGQHFVNNAYPLIDVVDRVLTFEDSVRYHFDRSQTIQGQGVLF